jgi:hypothetical protein
MRKILSLAAVLAAGGSLAGAVSGTRADDIPVFTSETPTVVTAETITPFQAAQVEFYKSTEIKPIPRSQSIKKLTGKGGAFSLPAHCTALCAQWAWAITDNIAIATWGHYYATRTPKEVVLGQVVRDRQNGDFKAKLALSARYRKKLRKLRKPVTITIRSRIVDAQWGFAMQREQKVKLKP